MLNLPISTLILGLLVSVLAHGAGENGASPYPPGTITVSGQATVPTPADRAAINLTVSQSGASVPALETAVAKRVNALITALKTTIGLPEDAIDSMGIRISPRSHYDQTLQRRVDDGFTVERTLAIDLHDGQLIGRVIAIATDVGITHIAPPRLYSSHREAAYQQALSEAVTVAQARAAVIAEAAGLLVDQPLRIDAVEGSIPSPIPMARFAMSADTEGQSFQAADIEVQARVTATFAVVEK